MLGWGTDLTEGRYPQVKNCFKLTLHRLASPLSLPNDVTTLRDLGGLKCIINLTILLTSLFVHFLLDYEGHEYPVGTTKSHLLDGSLVRLHSVEQCDLLTPIVTVYTFFFCFMPEHSDLDSMKNAQIFRFNENWPNIQIWIQ